MKSNKNHQFFSVHVINKDKINIININVCIIRLKNVKIIEFVVVEVDLHSILDNLWSILCENIVVTMNDDSFFHFKLHEYLSCSFNGQCNLHKFIYIY